MAACLWLGQYSTSELSVLRCSLSLRIVPALRDGAFLLLILILFLFLVFVLLLVLLFFLRSLFLFLLLHLRLRYLASGFGSAFLPWAYVLSPAVSAAQIFVPGLAWTFFSLLRRLMLHLRLLFTLPMILIPVLPLFPRLRRLVLRSCIFPVVPVLIPAPVSVLIFVLVFVFDSVPIGTLFTLSMILIPILPLFLPQRQALRFGISSVIPSPVLFLVSIALPLVMPIPMTIALPGPPIVPDIAVRQTAGGR